MTEGIVLKIYKQPKPEGKVYILSSEELESLVLFTIREVLKKSEARTYENPDCQKLFAPGRKNQRFCLSEKCRTYAQNQHALNWYHRKAKGKA